MQLQFHQIEGQKDSLDLHLTLQQTTVFYPAISNRTEP